MTVSGVEWIGEIPRHWTLSKMASLYSLRSEKVSDKEYPPLSVTMRGVVPQLATAPKTDDGDNRKLVRVGDFAINSRSDRRGSCGISAYEGSVSLINTVLIPRNRMNPEYYNWLFHSELFADEFYRRGHGIVDDLWTTNWQEMKKMFVPVPPLQEQQSIAIYLSAHCAEIDAIIEESKASIEEYKRWKASVIYQAVTKGLDTDTPMKDSGVSWIGEIPVTWDTCAIKRFSTKIGSGKTPSGGAEVYSDTGVIFLRSQNVYNEGLRLSDVSHISPEIDDSMSNTRVRYNDVLLNITGGSMGRCCLFDLTDTPANVNQHVCIIRTVAEMVRPEFLRYFWISESGPMAIGQYQTGGNRPGLNFEQIGNTKIPLCSPDEQDRIIRYLDRRCKAIDNLIEEKQSLIAELESYKKSLIYEAVTGKRKIMDEF